MTDKTKKRKPKGHCWVQKKKVNIFVDKKHNRNEVSWAKAETYQGLVFEAASGNWKFSSCGMLGLNNSTQSVTKASTQSQDLGQTTGTDFPRSLFLF